MLTRAADICQPRIKEVNHMGNYYYINDNRTLNPGLHHEVHTEQHARLLGIVSKTYLGYHFDEVDAVAEAKRYYSDADGCIICCPKAHQG